MSKLKQIFTISCMLLALVGFSITSQAASYKYDNLGRVIEATYDSGQTITYTYDAGENITSATNDPVDLKNSSGTNKR